MTENQREVVVGALGAGLTLVEATDLARVPQPALRSYWGRGEADRAAGRDTDEAQFVSDALHARALHVAELKTQANASAGTKEASDRLAMIRRLAEERLPEAEQAGINPAPRIYIEANDEETRRAARAAMEASTQLLEALAQAQARRVTAGA